MDNKPALDSGCGEKPSRELVDERDASMNSLIAWNIAKVLESNPDIDLKVEIAAMQELLETTSWDVSAAVSHYPEERYLACALLAWQQLGHGDANSLYQFIQSKFNATDGNETDSFATEDFYILSTSDIPCKPRIFMEHKNCVLTNSINSINSHTLSHIGPVVKLPVDTKIVMRCENMNKSRLATKKSQRTQYCGKKVEKKIDTASRMEPLCKKRLLEMDSTTLELKKRVEKLAKRESDRMKLLMRAEVAWKDLEQSYLKRLSRAEEKEEELAKQIKNNLSERSDYKLACTKLAKQLEDTLNAVDKERDDLRKIEMDICERARKKMRLSEDAAHADASLAQQQCLSSQHERDLRFKEEQARRKLVNLQNEVESSRGLRHEAERALRAELGALKDQVAKVSKRLLTEESEIKNVKTELEEIRLKKSNIIKDLEACKSMCDRRLHGKVLELKAKTEQFAEVKEKVLECQCKLPQDGGVEAKRTPSLAAICRCTSDDKLNESCSCKSLRSSLLSNLLKDLFEGLQSELGENGSMMPCELLKCLEDKHNWDRASEVKVNLRSFFAKLLVGELDIAIASSIEKYHAKWVGESCADAASRNRIDTEIEERQQRALENRAQELAKQLAEELFQEKAEKLMEKAKDFMKLSPPPCECDKIQPATTYSCILKTSMDKARKGSKMNEKINSSMKENSASNVTQLHCQMTSQKTKAVKKGSLKPIKERVNKLSITAANQDNKSLEEARTAKKRMITNQNFNHRAVSTDRYETDPNVRITNLKKYTTKNSFKRLGQSYAVNMCLFEPQKDGYRKKSTYNDEIDANSTQDENKKNKIRNSDVNSLCFLENICSVELNNSLLQPSVIPYQNLRKESLTCSKNCTCFNKLPSIRSLDNVLETYGKTGFVFSCPLHKNKNECRNNTSQHVNRILYHSESFDKDYENEYKKNLTQQALINNTDEDVFNSEQNPDTNVNNSKFDSTIRYPYINQKNNETVQMCVNDVDVDEKKFTFKALEEAVLGSNSKQHMPFLNNMSQQEQDKISSSHAQCCKYTSIERNICDIKTSVQSFYAKEYPENADVISKCIVDTSKIPLSSNGHVEFLGVTLNSSQNQNNGADITNKLLKEDNSGLGPVQCQNKSENENLIIIKSFDSKSGVKNVFHNLKNNYAQSIFFLDTKKTCICCNNDDENYDLEVNTFNLLMEYLQKKLEEFKLSSHRSSNISPYEANLFLTEILEKVKKMIIESSDGITCSCFAHEKSDNIGACWRRACGLLQEYLRTKIKRVECSNSMEIKMSNSKLLPDLLDKVCQLIENDFARLKKTCIDTNIVNNNQYTSKETKEIKSLCNETQSSDRRVDGSILNCNDDTNICFGNNKSVNNEIPSPNLITEQIGIKNLEKANGKTSSVKAVISSTCSSIQMHSTEYSIEKLDNVQKVSQVCHPIGEMKNEKTAISILSNEEQNNEFRDTKNNIDSMSMPYIDYTISRKCSKILSPCLCAKSISKTNKSFVNKILLMKTKNNPSYIIQNFLSTNSSKSIALNKNLLQEKESACEKEVDTHSNKEVIKLKDSKRSLQEGINHSTNISHQQLYDYLNYDEWDDCESVPYSQNDKEITDKEKLYKILQLPIDKLENSIDGIGLSNSDDIVTCSIRSENCECKMVPICHVKMLIDNIESKLFNSKCTCDSLNPNLCPAHYETVSF